MTIQWFPGHMAKAIRELKEKKGELDIIIEILDARVPISSRNPVIDEIFSEKPRVLIFNKDDLADPRQTKLWIDYFKEKGILAIAFSALNAKNANTIEKAALLALEQAQGKSIEKNVIKGVIIGIPNVGKSSLINKIVGKKRTVVGNKPGVTKKQAWIIVGRRLMLMDTPGILWPKFEDPEVGIKLAITHNIKEERFLSESVVIKLIYYLETYYKGSLNQCFKLDTLPNDPIEIIEAIGRKRGCFFSKDEFDYDRIYAMILREFRTGRLGRVTLDRAS